VETADKEDPVRPDVYEIAVVPGDGIGPEVSNATVSVLSSALDDSVGVKFTDHEAGAECYLKTGTAFPEATLQACKAADAILRGDTATDTLVLTRYGIERIVRMAARIALKGDGAPEDGVKRVSIVDKANVLRSYAFFRTVADEVLAGYTDIEVEHVIVDAMTVHMIERPQHFDVVVCENLLGDILSDLGAAIIGGVGLAPSGETGDAHGMFQGSHGTAPGFAGKNAANPVACVLSGAMMLEWLGDRHADSKLTTAAGRVRSATEAVLAEGRWVTPDLGGNGTTADFAKAICTALEKIR